MNIHRLFEFSTSFREIRSSSCNSLYEGPALGSDVSCVFMKVISLLRLATSSCNDFNIAAQFGGSGGVEGQDGDGDKGGVKFCFDSKSNRPSLSGA